MDCNIRRLMTQNINMEKDLKNKIIVVTGAAQGLGLEITRSFLKNGAKVAIILDINEDNGKEAIKQLSSEIGTKKAIFIKCDVVEDLEDTFENISKQFGTVDVLVNNAGVYNEDNPDYCIGVNLTATIKWSFKFYENMRKDTNGNGGTIINIASIMGYIVTEYCPVYSATKRGVIGFTKSLGNKNNYDVSGVRVIAICPGFTHTELTKNLKDPGNIITFNILNNFTWQTADKVGEKAVEIFETADSGSIWEIQGGILKEVIQ